MNWLRCCSPFVGLLIAGALQAAMTIDVVFTDTADGSWDAVTRGVVNQAIADWENEIVGIDDGFGGVASINVQFEAEFFNFGNGGPLGMWSGPLSASVGSNIRPWEATDASYTIAHTIRFNSSSINSGATNELWFDATPADDGSDKAFSDWDALTVARHEIGHMLGFSSAYADDVGLPSQSNPWSDKIIGDVFDPGGLNVAMEPGDVAHVLDDSLLMDTSLSNAEGRIDISMLELNMLASAYGYKLAATAIPEPTGFVALVTIAGGLVCRRRRR